MDNSPARHDKGASLDLHVRVSKLKKKTKKLQDALYRQVTSLWAGIADIKNAGICRGLMEIVKWVRCPRLWRLTAVALPRFAANPPDPETIMSPLYFCGLWLGHVFGCKRRHCWLQRAHCDAEQPLAVCGVTETGLWFESRAPPYPMS